MTPGGDRWRHLAGAPTATAYEPSETELGSLCAVAAAGGSLPGGHRLRWFALHCVKESPTWPCSNAGSDPVGHV